MLKIQVLYDTDFNLWVESQLRALQEGRYEDLDMPNLLEEIEDLGRRDRQALESHLVVIFTHLLKWEFQPQQQCNSWKSSIRNSRIKIARTLRDSPSLKGFLPSVLEEAYLDGRKMATDETGLPIATFPESSPYSLAQALDEDFLPES
ncbi:DUF29 domain-containing protein [Myxacorys almedinensis]|uniref:DUF29 family protein n=1 Tax=Myxacorys almedinensis A TaxID=2690445 RepID=A0A8J7Z4B4_9CYAN|nr:DUF29 domain-containing protein [Myxacorys almedinensis]NDJ19075.1 DUF29 family protein [Myxacorys almedinensis A]